MHHVVIGGLPAWLFTRCHATDTNPAASSATVTASATAALVMSTTCLPPAPRIPASLAALYAMAALPVPEARTPATEARTPATAAAAAGRAPLAPAAAAAAAHAHAGRDALSTGG